MKTITFHQFASIKRTAQSVYPLVNRRNKLMAQLKELNNQIDPWEQAVINMTGHTTDELVTRVTTAVLNEDGTQKVDKNNKPMSVTKYEPNSSVITFDEEKRMYVIDALPMTEKGNDFDADAKTVEEPVVEETNEENNPWND